MARPRENQRESHRDTTRTALLDAAAAEFAREGFRGANINKISTGAGFAKGTVYNYFNSKRHLMEALIQDTASLHGRLIREQVLDLENPSARLRAFFEAGFEFVETHPRRGQAVVNNLYGPDQGFRTLMWEAYQPLFQLLGEEILGPGLASREFNLEHPTEIAGLVMLVYLGTASQLGPDGKPWVRAELVADFVARALAA